MSPFNNSPYTFAKMGADWPDLTKTALLNSIQEEEKLLGASDEAFAFPSK